VSLPPDPNVKNIRMPGPEKYEGADDIDTFMNFLKALVRYMSIYGYGGPNWDSRRVTLLGNYLKGRAEFWYNKTIDIAEYNYDFETVMIMLFNRFVHTATAGNAWNKYESVEYKATEGVRALYDDLMDAADHLVQQPTEIEISKRFMSKLPLKIVKHLHKVRGVTAETTSMRNILEMAIQWENSEKEWRSLQKQNDATTTSQVHNLDDDLSDDETRTRLDKQPKRGRHTTRRRNSNQHSNENSTATPVDDLEIHNPSREKREKSHSQERDSREEARQGETKPLDHADTKNEGGGDTLAARVECYKCHELGHYARDCPNTHCMYAMQIENESDYQSDDDNGPYLGAMRAEIVHAEARHKHTELEYVPDGHCIAGRAEYPSDRAECLAAYFEIGGIRALTLFDTGSTFDTISPNLAQLCNAEIFELSKPVPIKLGSKGYESTISHGIQARTQIGPVDTDWYFDVSNIAFYDAIVGIPFCSYHNVELDVRNRTIKIDGDCIRAVTKEQCIVPIGKAIVKSKALLRFKRRGLKLPGA
jgi:hypothetical protein